MSQSSSYRMADEILRNRSVAQPLAEYLADQRDAGLSWQQIAAHLRDITDDVVDVSWMTVRRWFEIAETSAA